MKRLILFLFLTGIVAVIGLGGYVYLVTQDLPSIDKMVREGVNPTQYTQVFAADGTPILSYGKFRHRDVTLDDVSPHFMDALIATEDRRFYEHDGIDPMAIARAMIRNLQRGKITEGGSTLTQQLARNVFLSNERSYERKIREAALAKKLEEQLSKEEILELYINNIYFGEGAYGIYAASEIYFGKRPNQLSITEAAALAGMPQAPSRYNPFIHRDHATARRNEVLGNLHEVGKITAEELEKYRGQSIQLNPQGQTLSKSNRAPFFNQYVIQQVQRQFDLDDQGFWHSGLKIYTTLDLKAQRLAKRTLREQSAAWGRTGKKQQAALVTVDPKNGDILAYVGGKDFTQTQYDRATQAIRSPGSLFKVFTYTTAIDRGYEPSRVYLDEPIEIDGWAPTNYDKAHHGYMTMARALVTSNNIIAVKVLNELGPQTVVDTAKDMGIKSHLNPYHALTLGGSGVNLLEITSAIGVLANQGVRVEPHAVEKIMDFEGRLIYRYHPIRRDVLPRSTVDTMVKMLEAVVRRGTGRGAAIDRPMAGKTGTSDDYRDAWFVGFTPDLVTGVWVGNDDNSPMPGMTGGALPARIWRGYMAAYTTGRPPRNFDLAYSKPLMDATFETFDINNLSDGEINNPLSSQEARDGALDLEGGIAPAQNPDDAYILFDENTPGQPQQPLYDTSGYGPVLPPDPANPAPQNFEGRQRIERRKPQVITVPHSNEAPPSNTSVIPLPPSDEADDHTDSTP